MQNDTGDTANTNKKDEGFFLIRGETTHGRKFRPSDWCDRLQGTLRALGNNNNQSVASFIHIVNYNNERCFMVDQKLQNLHPLLYAFFQRFAKENQLSTCLLTYQQWLDLH